MDKTVLQIENCKLKGGPAACEAPAGSRSDKKLRRARSIAIAIGMPEHSHRGCHSAPEPGRRGFLSLRDPTALAGRSGHPRPAPTACA